MLLHVNRWGTRPRQDRRTVNSSHRRPVGQKQAGHAAELAGVVRHQGDFQRQGVDGDLGVERAYGGACRLQQGAQAARVRGVVVVEVSDC